MIAEETTAERVLPSQTLCEKESCCCDWLGSTLWLGSCHLLPDEENITIFKSFCMLLYLMADFIMLDPNSSSCTNLWKMFCYSSSKIPFRCSVLEGLYYFTFHFTPPVVYCIQVREQTFHFFFRKTVIFFSLCVKRSPAKVLENGSHLFI